MKISGYKCAWLLTVAVTMTGCAHQAAIDRLEANLGSPAQATNVVGKRGTRERPEFTTGGFLAGTRPYSVTDWRVIASTQFDFGQLTLLAEKSEPVRLGKVFDTSGSGDKERWDKILSAHFAAMAELLGGKMPQLDIRLRLVPSGVRYRFGARQPFSDYDAISLDLLAVIPDSGELDRSWLLAEAINAMHESFHVIRTDPKRFPRVVAFPEEEVQAYLLATCASVIAGDSLPGTFFEFPKTLEEAVAKDERDIAIADVYQQMVEEKDEPTVVGVNVAALAFFRYLTQLKSSGTKVPVARDSIPLCKTTARDELHWAEHSIDMQIKRLAEEAAAKRGS